MSVFLGTLSYQGLIFWGVILVVKTTSLRLHLGIIGATVRIRLGFSQVSGIPVLDSVLLTIHVPNEGYIGTFFEDMI